MSTKAVSPDGMVWTITIRDGADKQLLGAVVQMAKDMESSMLQKGWSPYGNAPYHRSNGNAPQNGQSKPDPPPALPEGGKLKDTYVAQDGTLMCAIHHTPLEQSQFNGYYCPRPGDGPRGYCTAKYTPPKSKA